MGSKFAVRHRGNRLKGLDSKGIEVEVQTAVPLDNCAADPAAHFVASTADFQHKHNGVAHSQHTGLPLARVLPDTGISHHGASAAQAIPYPKPSAPSEHVPTEGGKGDQSKDGDVNEKPKPMPKTI
ncbi:MAG: hypothetical protein VX737_04065 [Pseudomonadota bacterium]|nr:hypothetical protein [Pseudomonadota bacterium]